MSGFLGPKKLCSEVIRFVGVKTAQDGTREQFKTLARFDSLVTSILSKICVACYNKHGAK